MEHEYQYGAFQKIQTGVIFQAGVCPFSVGFPWEGVARRKVSLGLLGPVPNRVQQVHLPSTVVIFYESCVPILSSSVPFAINPEFLYIVLFSLAKHGVGLRMLFRRIYDCLRLRWLQRTQYLSLCDCLGPARSDGWTSYTSWDTIGTSNPIESQLALLSRLQVMGPWCPLEACALRRLPFSAAFATAE